MNPAAVYTPVSFGIHGRPQSHRQPEKVQKAVSVAATVGALGETFRLAIPKELSTSRRSDKMGFTPYLVSAHGYSPTLILIKKYVTPPGSG